MLEIYAATDRGDREVRYVDVVQEQRRKVKSI